jgi:hypothetical protein
VLLARFWLCTPPNAAIGLCMVGRKKMHYGHKTTRRPGLPEPFRARELALTKHAWARVSARGFGPDAVDAVLRYGRSTHIRGAEIFVIGRREVRRWAPRGVDLDGYEGVHVVCCDGVHAVTAYRNHDLRGLRGFRRRSSRRSA